MSDNAREAGSEHGSGPVREQVVIKDKRKIDMSGQPKTSEEAAASPAEGTAPTAPKEAPTMGQPAKPDGPGGGAAAGSTSAANGQANGPAGADATKTPVEQVNQSGEDVKPGSAPDPDAMRAELDERLRDLQRITAEYANYRKRVERDRGVMAEQAVGMVVSALLPILDDLDRAREHGDLVGQLATIAEQLGGVLAKFGLTGFGEQGDAFDPTRHEAVAHQTSADVTEPTCVGIMRRGYVLGEKLLRPALVAVADPE